MADPLLAPPLARDERMRALAAVVARLSEIDLSPLLVYLVDQVSGSALLHLAEQFHVLGHEGWNAATDDMTRRRLIKRAIELHRHKGTPWAVRWALESIGIDADLIDQQAQRAIYAQLNPTRVDSTWTLDGRRVIAPLELITGIPQIQHWAEFIVRINLASLLRPMEWALIRSMIDEWKPVRAWPLFLFWLSWRAQVEVQSTTLLLLRKHIAARYPWCGRVIGHDEAVRWALGRNSTIVKLPQAFGLFRLGEYRNGLSTWHLHGCRVSRSMSLSSHAATGIYRWPRLSQVDRRLNGAWRIGAHAADASGHTTLRMSRQTSTAVSADVTYHEHIRVDYPATPTRLGHYLGLARWWRLDGGRRLGRARGPCSFGFKVRREPSILPMVEAVLGKTGMTYANPETLPSSDLVYRTTPRHLLVRNRSVAKSSSPVPHRRLVLSQRWQLGASKVPLFTLAITKENVHG